MAEIQANVSDFDRTADNIVSLVDDIQTHLRTIGENINRVGNEWTDAQGAEFMGKYEGISKSMPGLIEDVEAMIHVMKFAAKAYAEAKGLVEKSLNTQA